MIAVQVHAIHVVFRLDDPTLQYDSVSIRALKLFNHKQVPLSIAIVSCDKLEQPILPVTHDDSLYLSELQNDNIELTLHGLTHQDINFQGEFGGLTYAEAAKRIRIGGGHFAAMYFARNYHFHPTIQCLQRLYFSGDVG